MHEIEIKTNIEIYTEDNSGLDILEFEFINGALRIKVNNLCYDNEISRLKKEIEHLKDTIDRRDDHVCELLKKLNK